MRSYPHQSANIRFSFAYDADPTLTVSSRPVANGRPALAGRRCYRGFVVRRCCLAVERFCAAVDFERERFDFTVVEGFGVDVVAPAETRLECFGRCRTVFRGAASANELNATTAASATSSLLSVL